MTTPEYLAKLESALTRDDWQYIEYATSARFAQAMPKPDEGKPSKEFLAQKSRVMAFLIAKAFG